MKVRNLFTDDRAVSPVVGVALLIAIAVILAAVIGAVVLGLGTGGVNTPQAQMQADFDANDVTIDHNGGEPLPMDEITITVTDTNGDTKSGAFHEGSADYGENDELSAGESITVTGDNIDGEAFGDDLEEATLVWEDPNSDSETVLEEFSD